MSQVAENNKRIAKNTAMLYIRMLLIMAVTLYTSRVVLEVLGVEDFGIYNVVGGVVAMMGVLNGAMAVSTQRYLTFELGKGDDVRLKQTFSTCLTIYVLFAFILLLLAETIGLWFLNTQLNIPPERMIAAKYVYQFSILSAIITLLCNPYNAVIIAHEKMDVYAYASIIEAGLKLVSAYILLWIPYDRLIVYGLAIMATSMIVMSIYYFYCVRNFKECQYTFYWEKGLFTQLLSYSGWNMFGSVSALVKGQGLNVLLNMFFNPSVNASRGIAYQVNGAVTQFFSNFYTAVRPQITKYYAQNDMENMFKLVFRSSKFSFYLILLISLPIIIETPYIIKLWLGQLPEYVVIFIRLIIVITAVDAMATPLMTTAHATGRIKLYQSVVGTLTILNIPISYLFLKYGNNSPVIVFVISLCISVIALFVRLWIVWRLLYFPVWRYIKEIFITSSVVAVLSSILPLIVYQSVNMSFLSCCLVCILSVVVTLISIYYVGLIDSERIFLKNAISKLFYAKK